MKESISNFPQPESLESMKSRLLVVIENAETARRTGDNEQAKDLEEEITNLEQAISSYETIDTLPNQVEIDDNVTSASSNRRTAVAAIEEMKKILSDKK